MRARDLPTDGERLHLLQHGAVLPVAGRCVQCGICSYSCPMGIDVRAYSRQHLVVDDRRCLRCGSCVERCPRGALQLGGQEQAA